MGKEPPKAGRLSDREYLVQGKKLAAKGDWRSAEVYFRHIVAGSSLHVEALFGLSRVLLDTDRAAEAVRCLREAFALEFSTEAKFRLGEALVGAGEYDESLTLLQSVHREQPQDPRPLIMVGHALDSLKRPAEAIKSYEAAIRADSKSVAARFYLTEALVRSKDLMRASGQLHVVLQQAPRYQPAWVLKGDLAYLINDHRQAIAAYLKAESLAPVIADVFKRMGDGYRVLGDIGQALLAYETAIARDPAYWQVYQAAGVMCETPADHAVARRFYLALSYVPDFAEAAAAGLARVEALAAEQPVAAVPPIRIKPRQLSVPPLPPTARTAPLSLRTQPIRHTDPALGAGVAPQPTPLAPLTRRETQPLELSESAFPGGSVLPGSVPLSQPAAPVQPAITGQAGAPRPAGVPQQPSSPLGRPTPASQTGAAGTRPLTQRGAPVSIPSSGGLAPGAARLPDQPAAEAGAPSSGADERARAAAALDPTAFDREAPLPLSKAEWPPGRPQTGAPRPGLSLPGAPKPPAPRAAGTRPLTMPDNMPPRRPGPGGDHYAAAGGKPPAQGGQTGRLPPLPPTPGPGTPEALPWADHPDENP